MKQYCAPPCQKEWVVYRFGFLIVRRNLSAFLKSRETKSQRLVRETLNSCIIYLEKQSLGKTDRE
jgi:hypothetical protein